MKTNWMYSANNNADNAADKRLFRAECLELLSY
jgi:hypothetical protein